MTALFEQVEVGLLQNFCTLVYAPGSGQVVLVDPAFEVDRLLRRCAALGLTPAAPWEPSGRACDLSDK